MGKPNIFLDVEILLFSLSWEFLGVSSFILQVLQNTLRGSTQSRQGLYTLGPWGSHCADMSVACPKWGFLLKHEPPVKVKGSVSSLEKFEVFTSVCPVSFLVIEVVVQQNI